MTRIITWVLLGLLVLISPGTARSQGEKGETGDRFQFKVAVSAVNLDVVVTDKNGRFIPGLTESDFEVFEDGVRQELSFFNPEVTPITVLLLLDASTSMRPSVDGVKEAAANFVRKLWDGDQAIVGDFNERVRFSTYFTEDVDRLVSTIQSLYPSGWTALYDAILLSILKLETVEGRKALLVFTDGDDSQSVGVGSEASKDDCIEGAKFSEVTIYSVGFEGRRGFGGQGVNKGFLDKLSEETGGAAFFPNDIGELNDSFSRIQDELHSQYRVAYIPSNTAGDGRWRAIEVRIKDRPNLVVRTRTGYYAVPQQEP